LEWEDNGVGVGPLLSERHCALVIAHRPQLLLTRCFLPWCENSSDCPQAQGAFLNALSIRMFCTPTYSPERCCTSSGGVVVVGLASTASHPAPVAAAADRS